MNNDVNWKDKGVDFAMNLIIGIAMAIFALWLSQTYPAGQSPEQVSKPVTGFFTLATVESSPLATVGKWILYIGAAIMTLKAFAALDIFDAHDAVSGIDSEDIGDFFN